MPAKRTPSAPGDADKLIAHQARLLKAPRTTGDWPSRAVKRTGH